MPGTRRSASSITCSCRRAPNQGILSDEEFEAKKKQILGI